MKWPRRVSVVSAILVWAPLAAQVPLLERRPELDRLAFFEGNWKGEVSRFLPNGDTLQLAPRHTFVWDLGGVWLHGRDVTELPDGSVIHNAVWLTWHPRKKAYTGAWQDNVFPGFVEFTGRWLDDGRLELDTGEFDLGGRSHRVIFRYRKESAYRFCTEMHQGWNGEAPKPVMQGCFERIGTSD